MKSSIFIFQKFQERFVQSITVYNKNQKVFSLYLTAYLKVEPDQQAEKIVVAAGALDVQILLVQEIQSVLVHVRHLP